MQRRRSSNWSEVGEKAWLLRGLALGQGTRWAPIALLSVGLLRVAFLLNAQGRTVTTTLILQVAEACLLERQNDNVIIKLRLTPGVAASLWGDKSCTAPADESYIITASGTYMIPLNQIKQVQKAVGEDEGSICLQSSDGVLRRSLRVIGSALTGAAMTSATKSAPQSVWSGHIWVPAPRVSAAKTAPRFTHTNSPAPR
jgi:hypothetical protein